MGWMGVGGVTMSRGVMRRSMSLFAVDLDRSGNLPTCVESTLRIHRTGFAGGEASNIRVQNSIGSTETRVSRGVTLWKPYQVTSWGETLCRTESEANETARHARSPPCLAGMEQ